MKRVLDDKEKLLAMKNAALGFAKPDAAERVGKEILGLVGVSL